MSPGAGARVGRVARFAVWTLVAAAVLSGTVALTHYAADVVSSGPSAWSR